jgi:hypothetical protein
LLSTYIVLRLENFTDVNRIGKGPAWTSHNLFFWLLDTAEDLESVI